MTLPRQGTQLTGQTVSGFVYDERMKEHKCLWDLKYNEKPERLTRVFERYIQCYVNFFLFSVALISLFN